MNLEQTKKQITDFIKTQVGDKPAIIGLSGGLDSSVVTYLAVEALGADKIHAVLSPSASNTEEDMRLAKLVSETLNIQYSIFNIDEIVGNFQKNADLFQDKKVIGNLKARIRMSLLYGKANELDGMVLGTGNKTEIMTGYFTKHGDGAVDILPIGDMYKTEERDLAAHLGVPKEIIDRRPTAGLWDDQYDEEEMGITYENLDKILFAIKKKADLDEFDAGEVELVNKLIKNSEHKRNTPPTCILQ
jgi:NAD+ synthase